MTDLSEWIEEARAVCEAAKDEPCEFMDYARAALPRALHELERLRRLIEVLDAERDDMKERAEQAEARVRELESAGVAEDAHGRLLP